MSQTASNINTRPNLHIPKPKIRIVDLEHLKMPSTTKLSKANKYIPANVSQENSFARTKNVSLSIKDQKYVNTNYQINNQSQPLHSQTSRILKFQLKEQLLKERLSKLKKDYEALQYFRRKKKSALLPSSNTYFNLSGKSKGKDSVKNAIQHSKVRKTNDKSRSVSPTEMINLSNSEKECFADADCVINSVHNPTQEILHSFEFVGVGEDRIETDLDESVSTPCPGYVENMTVEKCYSYHDNKKMVVSNMIQPELSRVHGSEQVDSTELRNGIIKASRTLINTQKALKTLTNTISRDDWLPPKQTVTLVRRFQSVLKSFNKGFDEISHTIKNGYKHIFLEFDSPSLLEKSNMINITGNFEQEKEIIVKEENCRNNTSKKSFLCKNKLKSEKTINNGRNKRGRRIENSDDEDKDKTYEPPTSTKRTVSQRSCHKRKYINIESQESDNELND